MTFGEHLRDLRMHFGISQEQVCADIGVHPNVLVRVETGETVCSLPVLRRLAVYYQYDIDILLFEMRQMDHERPRSANRIASGRAPANAPRTAVERIRINASGNGMPVIRKRKDFYWREKTNADNR